MIKTWQVIVVSLTLAALLVGGCARQAGQPSEATAPEIEQSVNPKQPTKPAAPAESPAKPETAAEAPQAEGNAVKPAAPEVKEPTAKPTAGKPAKPEQVAVKPKALPKLIDLGAEKCVPCKLMVPVLEELRSEYKGKLQVVVIDTGKDPGAMKKYRVVGIPTQVFYDASGKEVARHMGFISKEDIVATFGEHGIKL